MIIEVQDLLGMVSSSSFLGLPLFAVCLVRMRKSKSITSLPLDARRRRESLGATSPNFFSCFELPSRYPVARDPDDPFKQ